MAQVCFVALLATATTVAKSVEVHGLNCLFGENATVAVAAENNNRLLDDVFCAMYDLDFRTAEDKLAQFSLERPDDPMLPAADAASGLFSILHFNAGRGSGQHKQSIEGSLHRGLENGAAGNQYNYKANKK